MSRSIRIMLVIIAIFLSPLSLLTSVVVLGAVNPFGLIFLTSFTIDNNSGQNIWVSPIGAVGQNGDRHPLPFSYFKHFSVRSIKKTDFYIAKDTSRMFVYDWDDIQFSEILVRHEQGDICFIATDPNPTQNQYRNLKNKLFTIPSLSELPVASSNLKSALLKTHMNWYSYILPVIGIIPPILVIILWRTRKKQKLKPSRGSDRII